MDRNKIIEEILPFKDEYGFVTPVYRPGMGGNYIGAGNVLLYTGLYYTLLAMHGALTQVDIDKWKELLAQCKHERYPIYWRHPLKRNADDDQQHDDYWAIIAASFHAGMSFQLRQIYNHAEAFDWSFDIQRPEIFNLKYYFNRFIPFASLMKYAAGYGMGLADGFLIYGYLVSRLFFKKSASSNIRTYLIASVMRSHSLLGELMYSLIVKRIGGGRGFEGEFPEGHVVTKML